MLLKHPGNLFSFKKYFIRIARLYICIGNINHINVNYSHCGAIHFKKDKEDSNEKSRNKKKVVRQFLCFNICNKPLTFN